MDTNKIVGWVASLGFLGFMGFEFYRHNKKLETEYKKTQETARNAMIDMETYGKFVNAKDCKIK